MTTYKYKCLVVVPEAHIENANHLAQVLGETPEDINTFSSPNYENSDGNKYAVACMSVQSSFVSAAGRILEAPEHSPDANLTKASHAQILVSMWIKDLGGNKELPSPDKIVAWCFSYREEVLPYINEMQLTKL